jgi:hypothetical protein
MVRVGRANHQEQNRKSYTRYGGWGGALFSETNARPRRECGIGSLTPPKKHRRDSHFKLTICGRCLERSIQQGLRRRGVVYRLVTSGQMPVGEITYYGGSVYTVLSRMGKIKNSRAKWRVASRERLRRRCSAEGQVWQSGLRVGGCSVPGSPNGYAWSRMAQEGLSR